MKKYLASRIKEIYRRHEEDFYGLSYELRLDRTLGWPRVRERMGGTEKLDLKNFEWLEITDDKLVICCGGDWQEPMKVIMKLENNKLVVTETVPDFFEDGLTENKFNKLLFGTSDYNEIIK